MVELTTDSSELEASYTSWPVRSSYEVRKPSSTGTKSGDVPIERTMKHRSVVSNFIFKSSGGKDRVALFRRSHHPDVHTYQGKLAPISGSIDSFDADPFAAAIRELVEETQLVAGKDLKFELAGKPFSIEDNDAQRSWTVYPFGWKLVADETSITLDWEHEHWQWTDPDEVLSRRLEDVSVPQLGESLKRIYFGPGGIFRDPAITPASDSGKVFLAGLEQLRNDKENGARVLATSAVRCLADFAGCVEAEQDWWWHDLTVVAYHLIYSGRPSMNAAISSAVLGALDRVSALANANLACGNIAEVMEGCITKRNEMSNKISDAFESYIRYLMDGISGSSRLALITLSYSSTIRSAILQVLDNLPALHIDLFILESRPKCEGASLAAALLNSTQESTRSRLNLTISPDSHMAHLARTVATGTTILLLGADRISPSGHVSNKMGSCSAAIIFKELAPFASVVVLSETDKVAKPSDLALYVKGDEDPQQEMNEYSLESNDPAEVSMIWSAAGVDEAVASALTQANVEIQNIYFEWVPNNLIDVYVSEEGVLDRDQIRSKSLQKAGMEEKLFADLYGD